MGNRSENFRLGRRTCFFSSYFFSRKNIILCILKGEMPFKMHKKKNFPENLIKLGFTGKFRWGRVTLNTGIFLFGLSKAHSGLFSSQFSFMISMNSLVSEAARKTVDRFIRSRLIWIYTVF